MQKKYRYILLVILVAVIAVLFYIDPIPQPQAYHSFADQRLFFGIPNFWNVMSNLPMFFLGVYGLYLSFKNWSARPDFTAKWIPIVLCMGIFLACFGSMYYHFAPDNHTLVWDRLPMTLMFMPILSLVIYDFMGAKTGEIAFLTLVPLGVFSIFYGIIQSRLG